MGQQFLLKIERRTQVKLKDGNIFSRFDLLLRGVQRQRADILPLDALHPDTHPLDGAILIDGYPERIGKIGLRIEIFGQGEAAVGSLQADDPVELVDAQSSVGHAPGHDIPTLSKGLDTEWFYLELERLLVPKTLVTHIHGQAVAHRLNNLRQEALSGWNLLEEDAPFEVVALVDEVVHGKGV